MTAAIITTTRAPNVFTVSIRGHSYLTSRPDAGKQRQKRELPWSQLWPNLQHLYWPDEGWKNKSKYTGINPRCICECVLEASIFKTQSALIHQAVNKHEQSVSRVHKSTYQEVCDCTVSVYS